MINLSAVFLSDGGTDNAILESTLLLVHLPQLLANGNKVLLLVMMLAAVVHTGLSLDHLVGLRGIGHIRAHVNHGLVK